jgi:hypothetical protein
VSTVLATAVAAAGIGAIGAAAGAGPWEQAISNLAMAGHAGSASSADQPTATVFDSVIGLQPHAPTQAPKTQQSAGGLQLESHQDSTPGIAGTLSRDAASTSAPAGGGVIGILSAAAHALAAHPAGAQPSAPQTLPVLGSLAPATPAPGTPAPGTPARGTPAPGIPALGSPAPGTPAPGIPALGSPAPGTPALGSPPPGKPVPGPPASATPVPGVPAVPPAGTPAQAGKAHADAVHMAPAAARHAHAQRAHAHHAAVHHAPAKPYHIYDSVTPGNIPVHQTAAVYANGNYAASGAQVAGRGHVLWIDTNGSDPHADALDVEPGDATPAGAAAWVHAKLSSDHQSVAIVYTMISQWQAVKDNVSGLPHWMQDKVRYWIADPTGVDHVLPGANATQWYWGKNFDITTANPGFWS